MDAILQFQMPTLSWLLSQLIRGPGSTGVGLCSKDPRNPGNSYCNQIWAQILACGNAAWRLLGIARYPEELSCRPTAELVHDIQACPVEA